MLEPVFRRAFPAPRSDPGPGRPATDARERIRVGFAKGSRFFFEAGAMNFFGEISHEKLALLVAERVLKLIRPWLRAGVLLNGVFPATATGTRRCP
ncbi:MAG: hypothetical protein M0Z91_08110 [Actinomycetota bacterium]|nr:hypothetical protein [Actinomycetota bacterium]